MREARISTHFVAVWIFGMVTVTLVLSLAVAPARSQSTLNFTEWAVPTPSNCPFGLVAVSSRVIDFTEAPCSGIAAIGRLNTVTNTVTEWAGSALASPQGIVAMGKSLLFADQTATTINMLDTKTNQLTTWTVPSPSSGPLRIVGVGTMIFFTEQGGKIGMLNLINNQITEWTVPGGLHIPLGIAVSQEGDRIWFSQQSGAQVGALNPLNNTFQQWTIPNSLLASPFIQGIALSEVDHVFFADGPDGAIGLLDPSTDGITVWKTPTPGSFPTQLKARAPFQVDFTDGPGNSVWRLLTNLQTGNSTTVLPAITIVSPVVTPVTPSISTLTGTSSVATPTITPIAGIITGGFEQWIIPTVGSNPYAITELPGGGLAFTEANGNKIGILH